jgi:hypothetical protein
LSGGVNPDWQLINAGEPRVTYFFIFVCLAAIVHFLFLMVFVIWKKETTRGIARDRGGGDAECNFCLFLWFILTT